MIDVVKADSIFLYDVTGALAAIINSTPDSTTHSYVSATGEPLGYVYSDGAVYTYSGTFVGWYFNGILYDKQGHKIAFAKEKLPPEIQVLVKPPTTEVLLPKP